MVNLIRALIGQECKNQFEKPLKLTEVVNTQGAVESEKWKHLRKDTKFIALLDFDFFVSIYFGSNFSFEKVIPANTDCINKKGLVILSVYN